MWCESLNWSTAQGWTGGAGRLAEARLAMYFGQRAALEDPETIQALRALCPGADVIGCSTSGNIRDGDVTDDGIVAVAVGFDTVSTRLTCVDLPDPGHSRECGSNIGRSLHRPDLAAVFVLADGLGTNGSALVKGLTDTVGVKVPVTGGLAGDAADFARTLVGGNGAPAPRKVAAVGFYGERLRFGHGSQGGWSVFGPSRRITRAEDNVLYELDGKPALDLYKRYLGEEAERLPGSALLFPLKVWDPSRPEQDVVRTIVGVDEAARALVFAGDVPVGRQAQLMRGNFDRLAHAAGDAARSAGACTAGLDRLSIVVSCVGRKLLMGQRIVEETEAALHAVDGRGPQLGFYSYGEISPHAVTGFCELHNQTMTVTTVAEAA